MTDMSFVFFFFFNDTATTEIYTLTLHDALPISTTNWNTSRLSALTASSWRTRSSASAESRVAKAALHCSTSERRSEEHTSELQSRQYLVCRLLLEKKTDPFYMRSILLNSIHPYN